MLTPSLLTPSMQGWLDGAGGLDFLTSACGRHREVRNGEGQTVLEPCSPGERNSIAVTLTELAEQGKASQVCSYDVVPEREIRAAVVTLYSV